MSSRQDAYSFVLSVNDFDRSVLPSPAQQPGTDAFAEEVTRHFQREYADFGGFVRVVVGGDAIEVTWTPDPTRPEPMKIVLRHLNRGDYSEGIRLLEAILRYRPADFQVLYNLGLALSEVGNVRRAEEILSRAVELKPDDLNARVGLGVALARQQKSAEAVVVLRDVVSQNPDNPWAQQNLGACLMKLGRYEEAEQCLRQSTELNPKEQGGLYGLAQLLLETGRQAEAASYLIKVIRLNDRSPLAEVAEKDLSRLAQTSFRSKLKGRLRPDALEYLLGAIEAFSALSPEQVRDIALEIAILGQQGLNPNDPNRDYQLKNLPGRYTGLHLICLMYAATQQLTPAADIGFDLSAEYSAALRLSGRSAPETEDE